VTTIVVFVAAVAGLVLFDPLVKPGWGVGAAVAFYTFSSFAAAVVFAGVEWLYRCALRQQGSVGLISKLPSRSIHASMRRAAAAAARDTNDHGGGLPPAR
jgi:hypothetical protein